MGNRSKARPRNIPLEKALSAIVEELQALHAVVQALVNLAGPEVVQGALDAISKGPDSPKVVLGQPK